MGSVYEARWNHAMKIALKVNKLIDKGYLVYDEEGQSIKKFTFEGSKIIFDECIIFINGDKEWDDGAHDTITEFDKSRGIKDWKYIHPKHIHQLFRGTK